MTDILHMTDTGSCDDPMCPAQHVRRPVDAFGWLHSDHWKDIDGNLHLIAEMDPVHARNALGLLERRAGWLAYQYWRWIWSHPLLAPRGDMATDDVLRFKDESYEDPIAWLHTFPLPRALKQRSEQWDRSEFLTPVND
jgi:hypothetical protein